MRAGQLAESRLAAEASRHIDEYFPMYQDGHLLVAGGLADQPARFLAYMREIAALSRKVELIELEEPDGGGEG